MRSGVQDQPGQHGETSSLLKIQKISWAWWYVPVIPATWEAEAGELLEPGRPKLQLTEIAPLHSNLGNRASLHMKKKKVKFGQISIQAKLSNTGTNVTEGMEAVEYQRSNDDRV